MILTIKLSERKRQQIVDLNNWSAAQEKYFIFVMRQDTLRQMTQLCCNRCLNSCIVKKRPLRAKLLNLSDASYMLLLHLKRLSDFFLVCQKSIYSLQN